MEQEFDFTATAGLLSIMEDVFHCDIFPKLEYGDLLRLRSVCKHLKHLADDYIRRNFKSQEREISECNITFRAYICANLPTTKIYIKNVGPAIFEDPHVHEFLGLYADKITHVRVRYFSTCITNAEYRFFSALSNLEHLELEISNFTHLQCLMSNYGRSNGQEFYLRNHPFPANFQNLKTLKFNEIQASKTVDQYGQYPWDLIHLCRKLEHLKFPLCKNISKRVTNNRPFDRLFDYIIRRRDAFQDQSNLKFLDLDLEPSEDMEYFRTHFPGYEHQYRELIQHCYYLGIKLLNVDSALYGGLNPWPAPLSPQILTVPLISLVNMHTLISGVVLPNLEKLVIKSTQDCSFVGSQVRVENQWPKLKILDITINSTMSRGGLTQRAPLCYTKDLLDLLFVGKQRGELKNLAIRFQGTIYYHHPIPRVEEIASCCPNITKLTLTNWLGKTEQVYQLWEGLTHLEEVTLEECRGLGDADFWGEHVDDPSFLKLKNLKKLTLKGLHLMPNITDLAFQYVFRHLKIKQFYLQSVEPLQRVTLAGIMSLLGGDFNNYVERFPFEDWSLADVPTYWLWQIRYKFRASKMYA